MKRESNKKVNKVDLDLNQIADFFHEVGSLQTTPRSFTNFLGTGTQSVADHLHRVSVIAYTLALMAGADAFKAATLAMFHDISESRISDLNYVNQKYVERLEDKAHKEIFDSFPFGQHLKNLIDEYQTRETLESKLVKDADNLEFILYLKTQTDIGNVRAKTWIPSAVKRLKTKEAQQLVKVILKTKSDRWWFGDQEDEWWISRNK